MQESKALFTGPLARSMLSPRNGSETRPAEDKKWKAFALPGSKKESILLKKGSEVLYQVQCCDSQHG